MNDFLARCYPGTPAALGAVVVSLQITVAIAVAVAAAWLAGKSAARRHAVWLAALLCVLIAPVIAALAARSGVALVRIDWHPPGASDELEALWVESPTVAVAGASSIAPAASGRASNKKTPAGAPPIPRAAASGQSPSTAVSLTPSADEEDEPIRGGVQRANPWRAVAGGFFVVWAAGSALLLLRLLHGWCYLVRLRRGAQTVDARQLAGVLESVRGALGVKALPPILASPLVTGPVAAGVLRPCVVLPAELLGSLEDHQLRDVLVHEYAHLLRRDPLVGLLQRLGAILYWPHPLVHYLNRRLSRAREEVCDDYVLHAGDAAAYARTLLKLAERGVGRAVMAAGLMNASWKLEDRVARMFDPRRTPMTRLNPWTFAGLVAVLLAACTAGAAIGPAGGAPQAEKNTVQAGEQPAAAPDVSRARIDGVVVDEAGKPVAGAVVTALHGKLAPPTRTAADGSFRLVLDGASARYLTVLASADDGARQGTGSFQDTVLAQAAKLRIVMKPARKMTVRVTDAEKKPVDGAAVGIMSDSLVILAQAQTDARGLAALRFPADAHVYQVIALKPAAGLDYFENYRASPGSIIGEPPAQVALTLDGARSIAVRAIDSADKPVAGIDLVPWTIKKKGRLASVNISGAAALKYVSARSNGDGLAAFDWIPVGWQEGITILHHSEEYSLPDSPHLQPSDPEKTLVARLLRNVRIGGKVTLPDGKPAAGILLQVEGRGNTNHYFRNVVRTKADGSYTLLVYPNQSYLIAVTDEQWAAPSHTGIVVAEGEPRKDLDFRLGKGIIIRGKVTVGAAKKPAANQTITLVEQGSEITAELGGRWAQREELVRWAATDKDGQYTIRVGPGRYRLSGSAGSNGEEITLKGDETMDRDFHLDRVARAVLRGVVLANAFNGKPVGGAIIGGQESEAFGHVFGNAIADEQGRFQMERWQSGAFLYARNPEGTLATILPIGADEDDVKIVIGAAGKLRGRLIDKAGKPVAGARIHCRLHIGPEDKPHARASLSTQTDDAGRFAILGIVPGARCTVHAQRGEASQTLRMLPLTVAESLDLGDLVFDPE